MKSKFTPVNAAAVSFVASGGRWSVERSTREFRASEKAASRFRDAYLLGSANFTTFPRFPEIDRPFLVYDKLKSDFGKTAATIYITTLAIRALESTERGVTSRRLENFTGGFRETIRSVLNALEASREYWLFRIREGRDRLYRVERVDANDGDKTKQNEGKRG